MINRVVLVGRLTKNPEKRSTPSNASVTSFTLAVDNRTKDASGNKTTSFIPVICWNQLAENVAKYTSKGSLVGVEGRLVQRTYERKDGSGKAQVFEVVADSIEFLGSKQENSATSNNYPTDIAPAHEEVQEFPTEEANIDESDLPF